MARIKKRGLDYFPMDTHFLNNRSIKRISKKEGDSTVAVLLHLLSQIYGEEGYYVLVDDMFYEDVAADFYEMKADNVERIVKLAVGHGLFDKDMFDRYSILTSEHIQRQYLFCTRRRTVSHLNQQYLLVTNEQVAEEELDGEEKEVVAAAKKERKKKAPQNESVTLMAENVTEMAQSKENEKKEKNNTAEERKEFPPQSPTMGEADARKGGGVLFKGRKEWTLEAIAALKPPADGVMRNFSGLLENLSIYKVPPAEQYAIVCKSNYGQIGHPVWKGFHKIHESGSKIKMPGKYLLSLFR